MSQEIAQPVAPIPTAAPPAGDGIAKQVRQLPPHAIAALLARWARRLQPQFDLPLADLLRLPCLGAVEAGVGALERIAGGKEGPPEEEVRAFLQIAQKACRERGAAGALGVALCELLSWGLRLGARNAKEEEASSFENWFAAHRALWMDFDSRARGAFLADLHQLQALPSGEGIDNSPEGPPGALWPDLEGAPEGALNDLPAEEIIDNWRWIKEGRETGRFDEYAGQHVAVYRQQLLGASRDPSLLHQVLTEKHRLDPKRLVFAFIEA